MIDLSHPSKDSQNVVSLFSALPRAHGLASIVVPCYNEAKRLDVAAFSAFLDHSRDIRIVFVNDGSTDATLDVLGQIHARHPGRIEVLSLSRNSGKAEAVRQGLLHVANGDARFVGYWDADLATPLEIIEDFARIAQRYNDIDVVYGSRLQMLGHRVARALPRRIISGICARLARVAVGLPIGDTQCGAKLLRNTADLKQALAKPFSAGWLFDVELFTRLGARNPNPRAFYEFPLPEWTEIAGSKVTGRAIRRAGFAMLRLIAERRLGLAARPATVEPPEVLIVSPRAAAFDKAA